MEYISVYVTANRDRIELLKSHFDKGNLSYRTVPTALSDGSTQEMAFEVAEEHRELARKILHETGLLKIKTVHDSVKGYRTGKKWIPIVIAAIILILVVITIWWLMNSPAID